MKTLRKLFLLAIGFVSGAIAHNNENLIGAVKAGNIDHIIDLVQEAVDVNGCELSMTPLMYATWAGRTDIMQLLIERGAEVDFQSDNGKTALFYARNQHAIELLIGHGANINHQDAFGKTILNEIAYTEFAHWYQINDNDKETLDLIEFLLKKGLNVNLKDKSDNTVLSYIKIEGNYPKTIALLASYGAID